MGNKLHLHTAMSSSILNGADVRNNSPFFDSFAIALCDTQFEIIDSRLEARDLFVFMIDLWGVRSLKWRQRVSLLFCFHLRRQQPQPGISIAQHIDIRWMLVLCEATGGHLFALCAMLTHYYCTRYCAWDRAAHKKLISEMSQWRAHTITRKP